MINEITNFGFDSQFRTTEYKNKQMETKRKAEEKNRNIIACIKENDIEGLKTFIKDKV